MITLTIYFDDPWWVGVIEQDEGGVFRAARHLFGSEPSNEEVYGFILRRTFLALIEQADVSIPSEGNSVRMCNPKRAAREAARLTQARGISTKAQEALRLIQETHKHERQELGREQRRQAEEYRWQKSREKARARRRGH